MSIVRSVALFALLGGLPGCAWLIGNQAASARYSQEVTIAQARTAEVEKALADALARLDALEAAARERGQSENDRLETLESVRTAVQQLRGDVEKLRFDVDELKRSTDTANADADKRMLYSERRIGEVEKFLKIKPPPPPADGETGATGGTGGSGGGTEPRTAENPVETGTMPQTVEETLSVAVEHTKAGRPGVARALLQKAIEENPKSPKIAELHYRLAETYFAEETWGKAIKEYNVVVEGHPKSEWAPWALLYQGDAFVKKGQPENARAFWEFAASTYPKSDAAKEAKKRLAGK